MSKLRTPKGTLDLNPQESLTRDEIICKAKSVFEAHNGVPINTPMFELREILLNKYGEDTKLIYNLEDQGGDICSLRYDLTVPFSRYLCMNRIQRMRRYQIGNVFRRDNPSFKTGRLREFVQADFDICGPAQPMIYDSEIVKMVYDILESMNLPYPFTIKLSDRRVLNGMLMACNVPEELQATTCSTIDKLGKLSISEIEDELLTKGVSGGSVDAIIDLILKDRKETPEETITRLRNIAKDGDFAKSVDEMELLFRYLEVYGVRNVKFDLSLARGLDYYTGMIMEAVYEGVDVGSVAGGGRYDGLCDSLSEGTMKVPCVGFSIGVARIFALYPPSVVSSDVFVGSGYGLNIEERMRILSDVWKIGLRGETPGGKRVNYAEQVEYAKKGNFRVGIFTGDKEVTDGTLNIVYFETMQKRSIKRADLINELRAMFNFN